MKVSTLDLSLGKKKKKVNSKWGNMSNHPGSWQLHQQTGVLRRLTTAPTPGTPNDLTRYTKKPQLFSHP